MDIEEVLRQISYYTYQTGNAICDYIIGANYTFDSENNKYYTYKVFLSLSKPTKGSILDFNIILERVFVYRPKYEFTSIDKEKLSWIDIANFAIGLPRGEKSFYTVPLTTKLLFSPRIKKYFYRNWKYYKNYLGMLTQIEYKYNTKVMFYNVISLTNQGLINEALEFIRTENPYEYIRGAEDYECKLQGIQLQMLGFRRKYDFDVYSIPQKYLSIFDNIRKWNLEVQGPKVLLLYGRFNSSKTKVILSFVQTNLEIDIINIFNLKNLFFLDKSVILFLNDLYIPLDRVDITTQIGLATRKQVGQLLVQFILDSIKVNSEDFDSQNVTIFHTILDNLIVYDIESDFMHYMGNKVQSKQLLDYFSSKKRNLNESQ